MGRMRRMREGGGGRGETVVRVRREMRLASCDSDYIVAMRDGTIAHHGTSSEIMTSEVMRDVYDMDVEIRDVQGRKVSFYYV